VAPERPGDGREFWEFLAAVASGPRAQADGLPVAADLKPDSVELDLDSPAVAVEHRPGARQHRVDETRKLLSQGHTAE
jgi:hypothetical protein